jgi:SAM-dependent methyltransferase
VGFQERVLDFACADAKFTGLFDCSYYCGLDYSDERISSARIKFPGDGYKFFCIDFLTDPLPDQRLFGLGVCTHTLSHIDERDHRYVINKLADFVRDGFIIIHAPGRYRSTCQFIVERFEVLDSVNYGGFLSDLFNLTFLDRVLPNFLLTLFSYFDYGGKEKIFLVRVD